MFKKILVPLDGSEISEKILPKVEELAKSQNAQVKLMCAAHLPGSTGFISEETMKQIADGEREKSESYLEKTADSLRKNGLQVDWTYKKGLAATEIVATAKDEAVDLIAMATHGGGDVAWNLGSVTEKVINHAPVPVLLMPVVVPKPPGLKQEWFIGA